MLKELFSIFGTVSINNKDANRALDETTNKGKITAKQLGNMLENTGKIFTNVGKIATKAGTIATGITAGIVGGLSTAISRFDTLTNYPKVLSNLGFSAEDAKKSIDSLSKGIDGLPTALDDAASGVQRLVAKNNDINKSTKYFIALNDAIVAGNAPAQQQASAIEQLTQAYSKGKPDMMEWRTLMIAMPGQLKQIAKAMGYVSTDALYEALSKGKISMDKFMDAIVRLDEQGADGIISFQEQARNSCDSIGTAITNVSNRFKKGFATILTSMNEVAGSTAFGSIAGVINSASNGIKNFLDKIGGAVKENQAFKKFMEQIASTITKMNDEINGLSAEQLDKIVTMLVNVVKAGPALIFAGKGMSLFGSTTSNLGSVFSKVSGLTGTLSAGIGKLKPVFDKAIVSTSLFGQLLKFNVGETIKQTFPKLTTGISGLLGKVSGGLAGIGTKMSSAFPHITKGISSILGSFSGLFSKITPMLQKFLPFFAKAFSIAPIIGIAIAGLGLLQSKFGDKINEIAKIAIERGPTIIGNLVNGIVSKLPELIAQGAQLIQTLLNVIIANLPSIIQGGIEIISALVTGLANQLPTLIPMALELILTFVMSLLDNIDQLIDAGINLIIGLAEGLINAIPILIEKAPVIIEKLLNAIINNAPKIAKAGIELIFKLAIGIINSLPQIVEAAGRIISTLWNTLKELPGKAAEWGKDMINGFINRN